FDSHGSEGWRWTAVVGEISRAIALPKTVVGEGRRSTTKMGWYNWGSRGRKFKSPQPDSLSTAFSHRLAAATVVLVLLLGGACSSNTHVLRTTKGKTTTSTSISAPVTPSTTDSAPATTGATTAVAASPPTTKAPAPAQSLPATTPSGPLPAATSGRGTITGYVYKSCGGGQGSGCRTAAAGETIQVKNGPTVVASTQTAGDGSYRLDIPAGTYDVEVTRVAQSR